LGGRRQAARGLIYYFIVGPDLIFLADMYAKNENENLTYGERNQLQKIERKSGGSSAAMPRQ